MKALLFFVDNNPQEIMSQWKESNLSGNHKMVPFTPFKSVEETVSLIKSSGANIIVLGFNLTDGLPTGMDVLYRLKEVEKYPAAYISNTGGDAKKLFPAIDKHANRDGYTLWCAVSGVKDERFLGLGYEKNLEYFNLLLNEKRYAELLPVLRRVKNFCELESYLYTVLKKNIWKESPNTIRDVLDYFIQQREDFCPQHGYWVHSVSHFNEKLWELGLIDEVQRFIKISIQGANELSDDNCSGRLIRDFFHLSKYNDCPADFGIRPERLKFYEFTEYEKARCEECEFTSEEEYLLFQLEYADNPNLTSWSNDYQLILLEEEKIKSLVQRLNKLNNSYTFNEFMLPLYEQQCIRMMKMLKIATDDRAIERLNIALNMTKKQV